MLTSEFDYDLPEEMIAQHPPEKRGESRMLVMNRGTGNCEIRRFKDITAYLKSGDCIVINNTRVMNARFYGKKVGTGAQMELLLTMPLNDDATKWKSLIKPGRRAKEGTVIVLTPNNISGIDTPKKKAEETPPTASITVLQKNSDGSFNIRFDTDDISGIQAYYGHTPLPPYIKRPDECSDKERYQTVYAKKAGAVAAPTAGLHFTDEILAELADSGIETAEVTLHVGPGTFKPVSVKNTEDHVMHSEVFCLSEENAGIINRTRERGGRIVAVGTTSVRVLETCSDHNGKVIPQCGVTDIFLHPPMQPENTDILLTNFHLPKSTLLMLVATFAEKEYVLNAYNIAKSADFRFYSYGDCMLLIP